MMKAKSQKKIVEGDGYVDIISSLPVNVIECIMDSLPVRDAARTCVLSSSWRYVWADHPSLVLDKCFWDDIYKDRISLRLDYEHIVNKILVYHFGNIIQFVIDVSSAPSSMSHNNIDLWLSCLRRRGLKELKLIMNHDRGRDPYKLPSWVFSSSDWTRLSLGFCINIKSGCLTKLQSLNLEMVTFDSSVVLTTPLLKYLRLCKCNGILHFDIFAPRLESLCIYDNDHLNLKPFLTCTGILRASLFSSKEKTYFKGCQSFSFVKLLAAWPKISRLCMDGCSFKYLTTGTIPSMLDHQLNLRVISLCVLNLDSEQMPWILCILKNSPLLCCVDIWFGANKDFNGTIDIDESSISDLRMDQLHTVILENFAATPNELLLAKILLRHAPLLKGMHVQQKATVDPKESTRISENLFSLQQAFPKARIFESCKICRTLK